MIQLNEEQKAAADFLNGIAAVHCGPGGGKTSTMTHRIGNLVKKGINPSTILGLTFTRSAAQAMKEKLYMVLKEKASRVHLSTIHSFCMKVLRNEGLSFEILQGKEQIIFIKKIVRKKRINLQTGMILREISLAKNNLVPLDEFAILYEGDETMMLISDIFQEYEQEKKKRLLMDFDDLLTTTYDILKNNPEIRQKYQATWNHILVDEFQDTNPAQMELLRLLIGNSSGKKKSFWACGDDWQAIFAFTGASVGTILNFNSIYPDSEQFILKVNYRSTPEILKSCMNLISHNVKKIEKTLVTENPQGEDPIVFHAETEEDEANLITLEILDMVERERFRHEDIAVLYRNNFQSRAIEEAFTRERIPYHIEKGMTFYQRREVKFLLDYMKVIDNPNSEEGDDALKCIINIPNRYIGRKFINELETFSIQHDIPLWKGLNSMPVDVPYLKHNLKVFKEILKPLIKDSPKMNPAEVIHILRETLAYDEYICEDDIPSPDDNQIANINQLQIVANKFKDIKSLLEYTETFSDELSKNEHGVNLMTIHKSKGLEFPVVFIIGLVQGLLPNSQADIEEERRVCFVGMSRAKTNLYLSFPKILMGKQTTQSQFLNEITEHQDLP